MKKLLLLSILIASFNSVRATHISAGEITIKHIQNFEYEVKITFYAHCCDVFMTLYDVDVKIYQRDGAQLISTINLPKTYGGIVPYTNFSCGNNPLTSEKAEYMDTITLSPNTYYHPGGYLFQYQSCCRISNLLNIQNSSNSGGSIVTLFPPVVDGNGSQFINSTPDLNFPFSEFSVNQHPFISNYGGSDPDGDSLSYTFYTPFEDAAVTLGTPSSITGIWPDPTTQYSPIMWATGYGVDNQIHGFPGPNPSPNRLKIDSITGILSAIPDSPTPSRFAVGIWCREYRNGVLIGSVFRETTIYNRNGQISQNNPPQINIPQLQSLATWDADTMIFTGSPVCVQIGVTDPDSMADIQIEAVYSDYDPGDLTFVQTNAIILNPDTFQTALCFQPDSFLPYTTRGDVVAMNPGCYDLRGDTLPFYFKFIGYSNAGCGGNFTIPMTASAGSIDLFSFLTNSPNQGGIWFDIDGNNHMSPNGFLEWKYITTPKTYNFIYVQQEPNYPADTAYLRLNFVYPNSLNLLDKNSIKIYPNPAQDVLNISGNTDNLTFEIFDIHGKTVELTILYKGKNAINVKDLPNGIYILKSANIREKFIINR